MFRASLLLSVLLAAGLYADPPVSLFQLTEVRKQDPNGNGQSAYPKPEQIKVGEPPYLKLPTEVKSPGPGIIIRADTNATKVSWLSIDPRLQQFPPAELLKDSRIGCFMCTTPGVYTVYAVVAIGDDVSPFAMCTVIVGDGPLPPIPPKPDPPIPPKPDPPIPVAGLRVLIVYESATPGDAPKIIATKSVRDYLNTKCVLGADGKSPEWRFLDKDTPMGNASKVWQDAMLLPRQSLPWIIISTGAAGYSGPLPATADATLALLRKYGG